MIMQSLVLKTWSLVSFRIQFEVFIGTTNMYSTNFDNTMDMPKTPRKIVTRSATRSTRSTPSPYWNEKKWGKQALHRGQIDERGDEISPLK